MRRVLAGLAVLVLGALGALTWAMATPLRAGPIRIQLVDGFGNPSPEEASLRVDGSLDRWPTTKGLSEPIELGPGEHQIIAKYPPSNGCGTTSTLENGELTLRLGRLSTTSVRVVTMRIGPDAVQLTREAAELKLARERAHRKVQVRVRLADGTPAKGALVYCRGLAAPQPLLVAKTDEAGRAVCGPLTGDVLVHAGLDLLGGQGHLDAEKTEGEVTLAPAMSFHLVVSGHGAGPTSVTFNSQHAQEAMSFEGSELIIPGFASARTIVCATAGDRSACEVVTPEESVATARLALGEKGTVVFEPGDAKGPLDEPIVYLDRHRQYPVAGPEVRMTIEPGRHLLILNTGKSGARFETVFAVEPGKTTNLGQLVVR